MDALQGKAAAELADIEIVEENQTASSIARTQQLNRTGILTALAIALHNFPEGLATFVSVLVSPSVGIPVAIAIAIHVCSCALCQIADHMVDACLPAFAYVTCYAINKNRTSPRVFVSPCRYCMLLVRIGEHLA